MTSPESASTLGLRNTEACSLLYPKPRIEHAYGRHDVRVNFPFQDDRAMSVIFLNRYFYPDHSATSQMLSDLAFFLPGAELGNKAGESNPGVEAVYVDRVLLIREKRERAAAR